MGTKTITMYVSDLDQSEIPGGQAYQLSIRHPDGSTQQLDISEKNYRDLKLAGVGKTLKKRGRKPGATTAAAAAPRKRRPRQNGKPPATALAGGPGGIDPSLRPASIRRAQCFISVCEARLISRPTGWSWPLNSSLSAIMTRATSRRQ